MDNDNEPEVYAAGNGIEILADGTVRAQRPPEGYEEDWHASHDNIVRLAEYMRDTHDSIDNVVHMVGKPWHYDDLYREMLAAEAEEEGYERRRAGGEL